MGQCKADLPFGSQTLLERTVEILSPLVDVCVLVAGREQQMSDLLTAQEAVIVVRDEQDFEGPLFGLANGLKVLPSTVTEFFLGACDSPFLSPQLLKFLFEQLRSQEMQAVVPEAEGFPHPLCAVYQRDVNTEVDRLVDAGERKFRRLLERLSLQKVGEEELKQIDPQLDSLCNLNSPADYFKALERAGLECPSELWQQMLVSEKQSS